MEKNIYRIDGDLFKMNKVYKYVEKHKLHYKYNAYIFKVYEFTFIGEKRCLDILNKEFFDLRLRGIHIDLWDIGLKSKTLTFNNKTFLMCYETNTLSLNKIKQIEDFIKSHFIKHIEYKTYIEGIICFSKENADKLVEHLNNKHNLYISERVI